MDYSKENNDRKKSAQKLRAKKVKNKIGILIFRTIIAAILIGGFALCGVVAGAYISIIEKAPQLTEIMLPSTEKYTSIIYDEKGVEIDRLDSGENREFASLEEIPLYLQNAFVAIEDERFYSHNGIDVRGIVRAITVMINSDRTEGASTITQQLIKNKLKITRNSFVTKFQEQYLAMEYEQNMIDAYGGSKETAKEKILEIYLNSIGLGYGQVGVQAAANRYFNKDVSELTLAESAVIAAITQNPTYRDPIRRPLTNQKRQHDVLDKMLELNFITQQEYDEAYKEDVYSKINATQQKIEEEASYHSYFTDKLISEVKYALENRLAYTSSEAYSLIYEGGIKIIATIDTEMQDIVDKAFLDETLFPEEYAIEVQYQLSVRNTTTGKTTHYSKKKTVKTDDEANAYVEEVKDELLGADDEIEAERIFKIPQPQAGMCIIDYHNGKVRAMAGGRGEKQTNRGLNRATDSQRQPGSVFKVLASYAPALDLGLITPATVIDDVPFTAGNYSPNNWYTNPTYRGLSTVREGIINSMNVITVKNMYDTGITNCFNYLMNFGFSSSLVEEDRNLSTALGGVTYGVTQVEVAAAYGAIANGGIYYEPIYFTQVLDHDDNVILENIPQPQQVLKKTTAYLLTDMMQDVIKTGTGGRAAFKNISMPVAGKTGTTSEDKDLVFAGYTPYYSASIYLGYDTPKSMKSESKGYQMQIWSYVMERIHENLPTTSFEIPEGIVYADICKESGKLPREGICSSDPRGSTIKRNEIFAAGTQPTEYCDVHRVIENVDLSTGLIANEFCPPESIGRVVGIVRPEPYYGGIYIGDKPYELSSNLIHGIKCSVHEQPIIPDDIITGFPDSLDLPSYTDPVQTNPDAYYPQNTIDQHQDVYAPQAGDAGAPLIIDPPTQPIEMPTNEPVQSDPLPPEPTPAAPEPAYTAPEPGNTLVLPVPEDEGRPVIID